MLPLIGYYDIFFFNSILVLRGIATLSLQENSHSNRGMVILKNSVQPNKEMVIPIYILSVYKTNYSTYQMCPKIIRKKPCNLFPTCSAVYDRFLNQNKEEEEKKKREQVFKNQNWVSWWPNSTLGQYQRSPASFSGGPAPNMNKSWFQPQKIHLYRRTQLSHRHTGTWRKMHTMFHNNNNNKKKSS